VVLGEACTPLLTAQLAITADNLEPQRPEHGVSERFSEQAAERGAGEEEGDGDEAMGEGKTAEELQREAAEKDKVFKAKKKARLEKPNAATDKGSLFKCSSTTASLPCISWRGRSAKSHAFPVAGGLQHQQEAHNKEVVLQTALDGHTTRSLSRWWRPPT